MKIKKAIILVEMEDGKVRQVNSKINETLELLTMLQKIQGGSIEIDSEPICGVELILNENNL